MTGHRVLLPPEILLQVWNQHAERLLLIVRGFGQPAEDAVQEAFVRLATQDEVPDETLAWLVRVARNQLLQWWRSDSRSRRRESECGPTNDWFAEGMLDDALDAATVTEGLQQLPDDKRATLMMHIWGGLSFEQIAAILGVSRSTAHRHYTLAMEELRTKFCSSNNSFAESPDHES
ncbi:MAG: RNA polymerase sigma factor [Pirellulaceae bacterium]